MQALGDQVQQMFNIFGLGLTFNGCERQQNARASSQPQPHQRTSPRMSTSQRTGSLLRHSQGRSTPQLKQPRATHEGIFAGRGGYPNRRNDRASSIDFKDWGTPADEIRPWEVFGTGERSQHQQQQQQQHQQQQQRQQQQQQQKQKQEAMWQRRLLTSKVEGHGEVRKRHSYNWDVEEEGRPWEAFRWQQATMIATLDREAEGEAPAQCIDRTLDAVPIRDEDDELALPPTVREELGHGRRRRNRTAMMSLPEELLLVDGPITCSICCCEDVVDAVSFRCNSHYYCIECMRQYLSERISAGVVARCPERDCAAEAGPILCQRVLSAKQFDQYLMLVLRSTHRLKDCPSCHTSLFVEERKSNTGGTGTTAASAKCPKCRQRFCAVCGLKWHSNLTCEDARARLRRQQLKDNAETFDDLSVMFGFKRCPQCGEACEKLDAADCDHITCVTCRCEFCWLCMADRKVIFAHGNHFHNIGCKFYSAYDGPLEYIPQRCEQCRVRKRPCEPPRQTRG
eukprot:TRINITY_DN7000_c1_g3_i1.p1 TRINITY_DN7000_c1_g3~~TRINITY_DN7000_c1_g3_i1.p1  ORF type:complete len:511 (+),score=93.98 TRINITY_DN7000_c1_g3_i1:92-1624(+)